MNAKIETILGLPTTSRGFYRDRSDERFGLHVHGPFGAIGRMGGSEDVSFDAPARQHDSQERPRYIPLEATSGTANSAAVVRGLVERTPFDLLGLIS